MKRIRKTSILYMITLTLLLSACSYKDFEDSLKSKLNNEEEEVYVNPTTTSIPKKDAGEVETDGETADSGLFSIGDAIKYTYDGEEEPSYQYTLNQALLSDNINDLNLDKSDFTPNSNDTSLISDNGNIDEAYQLGTVDVTIRNLNSEVTDGEPNLAIQSSVGFKDEIEDINGPFLLEASYFSEHPPIDQNDGKDYYYFLLPIGEELNATVG